MPRTKKKSEKAKSLIIARKRLQETDAERQTRLKKNRSSHAKTRLAETEQKKEIRLAQARSHTSTIRSLEDQAQKSARLAQVRSHMSKVRSQEDQEQKSTRLAQVRSHATSVRSLEDDEQKSARLAQVRSHMSTVRSQEDQEQKFARLAQVRSHTSKVRSQEDQEQKSTRLAQVRSHMSTVRSLEDDEQKSARLAQVRSHMSTVRSQEDQEQKSARLAQVRSHTSKVRSQEDQEQKSARLVQVRSHMSTVRSQEDQERKSTRLAQVRSYATTVQSLEDQEQKTARLAQDRIRKSSLRSGKSNEEQVDELSKRRMKHSLKKSTADHQSLCTVQLTPFEIYQKNLNWGECSVCLEKFVGLKTIGGTCRRCVKFRERFNKFSLENDMDPGIVPNELSNLTMVEEQLIARVHPVITVYKLRGGQLGYSGQVINFPQDIHEVAKVLPKCINDLSNIIVFRRNTGSTHADFMVNRNRVYNALYWLKSHNIYYKDIEIDTDILNSIPENENILDSLSTKMEEDMKLEDESDDIVSITDVPNVLPRNNEAIVRQALGATDPVPWPALIPVPINEFNHTGYIAMAFPKLFPTGAADLRAARQEKISPFEYFRHLILYRDQRFAKHPRFRFFAMNSLMRWEALKKGSVCIQKNSEFRNYTVQQLKEAIESNPGIARKLLAFNSSLRGSSTYWYARSRELLDMVKFLGPPTLFVTLSAADLYWPEVFRLIQHDNEVENLSECEILKIRRIVLNENPLVFSHFFKERAEFFIRKIICPKFKVKDFWYRTEFQHRGSPHIHGIFWLEGAPEILNLDNKTQIERDSIAEYFGNIISTMNPDFNSPKPPVHPCSFHYSEVTDHEKDYVNLLNACQRHTKHGPQCLRKLKTSREEVCRFKFPFHLEERTHLCKEEGKWILRTKRNDPLMNTHNRYITEHWRANTDIQPILSIEAVLNYIAKYASKSEPKSRGLESLIEDTLSKVSSESGTVKSVIQRIFIKICSERDYSAQESFHILMGWPLYHSSREFVRLNIEEDKWISIEENNEIDNVHSQQTLYDTYPLRSSELESLSIYDYFSQYYKRGNTFIKRLKPAVVRILPRFARDCQKDNEEFYRQQVITRIPWRKIADLRSLGPTWKAIYETFLEFSKTDISEEIENLTEIENEFEAEEEAGDEQDKEDWMVLAGLGIKEREIKIGMRPQDINFDWSASYSIYESPLSLQSFISVQRANAKTVEYDNITIMPKIVLSEEQVKVLDILKQQLECIGDKSITPPRSVIVQGRAGSGKSTLIHAMIHKIHEKLGKKGYVLLAPTGAAALNIGGSTIHSALHIGNERQHRPLSNELLHSFQCEMNECQFIIIDEMSMLGCSLLKKIDLRCREAKPNQAHEPFGGLFIYLLGDIKQLPPVMDRPLYGHSFKGFIYDQGQLLFQSIEKCIILKNCHRQQGKSQERFREILDRLSVGQSSVDDWKYLMFRNIINISNEEMKHFHDSIHLFSTNSEVHQYNMQKLETLSSPVAIITAQDNNKDAGKYDHDISQGLETILYLSIGARVMLRTNLWISKGLVNGALGTVKDILYKPGTKPPRDFPISIIVEFDQYTGPTVNGLVPIPPISRSWSADGKTFSRTQFPLSLAWGITIHKSQGLTLSKTVINIGERELMLGITYVALSRVRCIEDLVFDPGFSYNRLENIRKCKLLESRIAEEKRLLKLT